MAFEGEGAGEAKLSFAPAPMEFASRDIDMSGRDAFALTERGVCYILSETLIDLSEPAQVYRTRLVQQVTGSDGLQPTASFEIVFDPAHERLVIHTASVLRDGERREAASPAAFELLRRELNLERAMYDGRLTAHMIIPDVRVGDIVETAFSIIGANPALGGRFSRRQQLQWAAHLIEADFRVRAPQDRALVWRTHGAAPSVEETLEAGVRQWRWRQQDIPALIYDNDTPAWWIAHSEIHIADRMSWDEVAALFRDHYLAPAELPQALTGEIDQLAVSFATAGERAAEALRFVQRLLRYHSVGMGAGGFRPRAIREIWDSRYGDCKDASRLLTVVLQRLGLEACPALVNTATGAGLNEAMPHATAFDHCVVRAEAEGKVWWLDPTMAPQAGRLSRLTQARPGWALPLRVEARLEQIREVERQIVCETFEEWTFGRNAADPAELKLRTIYRSWRADDMRRRGENEGFPSVSRRMREGLERTYGEVSEVEPLTWADDTAANEIALIEHYSVSKPFAVNEGGDAGVKFESLDDVVGPTLVGSERPRREQPIHIGTPRIVRVERVLNFPIKPQITPWNLALSGPGVTGRSQFEWLDPKRGRNIVEVDVERSIVAASEVRSYFAFQRRMRANNGISFVLDTRRGRLTGDAKGQTTWRSWAVVGAIVLLLILLRVAAPGA